MADIYYYYYYSFLQSERGGALIIICFLSVAERGEHFFSYGVLLDARMKQLKSAEAMYGRAIELAPQV